MSSGLINGSLKVQTNYLDTVCNAVHRIVFDPSNWIISGTYFKAVAEAELILMQTRETLK